MATDRFSGKAKGFAFVTMSTQDEAEDAVKALNGTSYGPENKEIKAEISHGQGGRKNRESREMDEARATGQCFDYIRGRCSRGSDCRFKHGNDRDRGYGRDRRSRSPDRGYGRDRDRRSPDRGYGRDRDRRRSRSPERGYGRDRDRRDDGRGGRDRRSRSRSRDRDYRR